VNQSISNEARSYEASLIERRPLQGRSRGMRRVQSELNVTGFGNAYAVRFNQEQPFSNLFVGRRNFES